MTLFAGEVERTLPAVASRVVKGEFLPDGWQGDGIGWRASVKQWLVRSTTKREEFVSLPQRFPLVATDRFSNGYFHWVTETLPRLWWYRDLLPQFELLLPGFALRFRYMRESLALFPELATRVVPAHRRWWLSEAVHLPPLALTGNYRPELMQELGAAWRSQVQPQKPFRKLYLSRSQALRRRVVNEAEVRQTLEAQGFETIHFEGWSFADQVKILAETTHLVSNHGAGLTNMLFMVPGTQVTEIRLRGDAHNNCYFSLARALNLEYHYRLADPVRPGTPAHHADLVVDPGELHWT